MKTWFDSIWQRIAAISNRLRNGTKNAPGTGSGVRTSGGFSDIRNTGDLPRSASPSYAGGHRGSGDAFSSCSASPGGAAAGWDDSACLGAGSTSLLAGVSGLIVGPHNIQSRERA